MYFSQEESYSSGFQNRHSQIKKAEYLTTTEKLICWTSSRLSVSNSIFIDEEAQTQIFAQVNTH